MRRTYGFLGLLILASTSTPSFAKSGGGSWSITGAFGITSSSQDHLNSLISTANSASGVGPISNSQLGSAYEFMGGLQYRFTSSWLAFQFRPAFFYQKSTGNNASGQNFEFALNNFVIMPIARFYMLENAYIKFFSQLGIGVGVVNGEIKEPNWSVKYSGAAMGYLLGLGAEFCFFGGPHCMLIEGNFRYLPVNRLTVDSSSGTGDNGITQIGAGQELEIAGGDLSVTMSGVQGFLGYVYNF